MLRHCDGTDKHLSRLAANGAYEPCACGLRFDDADRLVIWPHHMIRPVDWAGLEKLTRELAPG
jgi:hypothetical protein